MNNNLHAHKIYMDDVAKEAIATVNRGVIRVDRTARAEHETAREIAREAAWSKVQRDFERGVELNAIAMQTIADQALADQIAAQQLFRDNQRVADERAALFRAEHRAAAIRVRAEQQASIERAKAEREARIQRIAEGILGCGATMQTQNTPMQIHQRGRERARGRTRENIPTYTTPHTTTTSNNNAITFVMVAIVIAVLYWLSITFPPTVDL
jgi:hypothetical protein